MADNETPEVDLKEREIACGLLACGSPSVQVENAPWLVGELLDLARDLERRLREAEAERDAYRDESELRLHMVLTCGVAADHPDANLSRTGAYAGKWNTQQAERVRKLRDRAESAERARDEAQRIVDKLLTEHPSVTYRLLTGKTLTGDIRDTAAIRAAIDSAIGAKGVK